jgi:alginate O-acetyltransferase complex protein AlgI
MLFNSFQFLFLFLPVTLACVFGAQLLQNRIATLLVLAISSAIFYAFYSVWHLALLLLSILINWTLAEKVGRSRSALLIGVTFNLAVLFLFKYSAFAFEQLRSLKIPAPEWSLAFPLAISFYTFHQISFLVDISRAKATRPGLLVYSSYILLFPQLVAGPIVRYSEIASQLSRRVPAFVSSRYFKIGLVFVVLGLSKKTLLADYLAPFVDEAFANPTKLSTLQAWQATLGFGFQIYFDFSGYTDMAIGLAYMMGLRLPRNFNDPYRARDISDFWRRWHISLSRFLRDYLYKSLGGNRHGLARTLANLMIVMLLGGLWHGANWTFVAWGGLHGAYLVAHRLWVRFSTVQIPVVLSGVLTYVAVSVAWVFFRAHDFATAREILSRMATCHEPVMLAYPLNEIAFIASVVVSWALPQTRAVALRMHRSNALMLVLGFLFTFSLTKILSRVGHADAFIYFAF